MSEQQERLTAALASQYRIEREIGRGGMATVYLARDLKHDRPVAVKVLHPEFSATLGADRFLREINIAANLNHPHILPLHDSGKAGGFLYYVMPFVEGETLAQQLHREPRPPIDYALRIAREVASALDYAHRQHVVHRDIKPANILLSGGHAVVADFGIARAVRAAAGQSLTQEGAPIGTPAYMSPEQATSEAELLDGRTDIYSLGCVLYEMLAGRPPYQGPTVQAILAQVITGDPPLIRTARPDIPRHLGRAIARALAKPPDDRFSTAAEFAETLQTEALQARSGRKWTYAGVAAVAILLGAAWWLRPTRLVSEVATDAQVIAVVPFSTSGPAAEVLGEGMVDLLSTNLDGVGGIRTVDPRTVLHRWRQRTTDGALDLDASLAVARELDAGSALIGSVIEAGAEVRLTAELFSVRGERLARTSADGAADSVLSLVDSLSLRLLREIWRSRTPIPDLRVSAITTGSLTAIRAYLQGEHHYRRSNWDSAAAYLGTAIDADQTFSLALFRMGQTISWIRGHGSPIAVRLGESAAEQADRLPPREGTLVLANQLFQAGDLAALDTLRSYVVRYPDDAEGWFQYADVQFHARYLIGADQDQLYAAFDRVFELDSTFAPALIRAIELSVSERDSTRFNRYFAALAVGSGAAEVERFRLVRRVLWEVPDSAAELVAEMAAGPAYDPTGEAIELLRLLVSATRRPSTWTPRAVLSAIDTLLSLTPTTDPRHPQLIASKGRTLNALGRVSEAREIAAAIFDAAPERAREVGLTPLVAGYVQLLPTDRSVRSLEFVRPRTMQDEQSVRYWQALYALTQRDVTSARALARGGLAEDTTDAPAPFRGLFNAVLGWADLVDGDTTAGTRQLRDGLQQAGYLPWVTVISAPLRFQLARVLLSRGNTRREGIGRLQHGIGPEDQEFVPLSYLALGQALEATGDAQSAAAAYAGFVRWWENADPDLQPMVDQARRQAARLGGSP